MLRNGSSHDLHADADAKAVFPCYGSGRLELFGLGIVLLAIVNLAEGDGDGTRLGVLDGIADDGTDDLPDL